MTHVMQYLISNFLPVVIAILPYWANMDISTLLQDFELKTMAWYSLTPTSLATSLHITVSIRHQLWEGIRSACKDRTRVWTSVFVRYQTNNSVNGKCALHLGNFNQIKCTVWVGRNSVGNCFWGRWKKEGEKVTFKSICSIFKFYFPPV